MRKGLLLVSVFSGMAAAAQTAATASILVRRLEEVVVSEEKPQVRGEDGVMICNLKLTSVWRFNWFNPRETESDTPRFGTGK